jgi:hypothetical protein
MCAEHIFSCVIGAVVLGLAAVAMIGLAALMIAINSASDEEDS